MFGYYNRVTLVWLDNDFQFPHFPDIHALIAACYPSEAAFTAEHGNPGDWEKREISDAEIMQIFSGGN